MEQLVANTVEQYLRQAQTEWRVMAKDPLFSFYGGVDSPARQAAYVERKLQSIRSGLTDYLHRPECLALAEALDDTINNLRTA